MRIQLISYFEPFMDDTIPGECVDWHVQVQDDIIITEKIEIDLLFEHPDVKLGVPGYSDYGDSSAVLFYKDPDRKDRIIMQNACDTGGWINIMGDDAYINATAVAQVFDVRKLLIIGAEKRSLESGWLHEYFHEIKVVTENKNPPFTTIHRT